MQLQLWFIKAKATAKATAKAKKLNLVYQMLSTSDLLSLKLGCFY
jgi:hypothetical protein